jgi:leukotriene-A4 hydrolase
MQGFGLNNNFSSLYPIVDGDIAPDGSFSTVPYEKGFQLLYYIQSLIGEKNMQQLLRNHINRNSLTSINYTVFVEEFEKIVNSNFDSNSASDIIAQMNWTAWVHEPGLAPVW